VTTDGVSFNHKEWKALRSKMYTVSKLLKLSSMLSCMDKHITPADMQKYKFCNPNGFVIVQDEAGDGDE